MPRKAQDVTDAELAVLSQLWAKQTSTVRELAEQLYGASTASDLATVQKLLGRLEEKHCVRRDRNQWPHQFEAIVERADLIQRRLRSTANELCDGSLTPLITHLVQSDAFDAEDRRHLRDLLDKLTAEDQAAGPLDAAAGPSDAGPLDHDGSSAGPSNPNL